MDLGRHFIGETLGLVGQNKGQAELCSRHVASQSQDLSCLQIHSSGPRTEGSGKAVCFFVIRRFSPQLAFSLRS